jgi:hypothetical protein
MLRSRWDATILVHAVPARSSRTVTESLVRMDISNNIGNNLKRI